MASDPNTVVPSAPPPANSEQRNWAMAAHLCGILWLFGSGGFFFAPFGMFGLGAVIGPFIIWKTKGEAMPFVAEQARESLNFQLTVFLLGIACWVLAWVLIGFVLMWILGVVNFILVIIAAINVSDGKSYRYPFCFRFFS
jgi:uncharacterized Tic20 family protein